MKDNDIHQELQTLHAEQLLALKRQLKAQPVNEDWLDALSERVLEEAQKPSAQQRHIVRLTIKWMAAAAAVALLVTAGWWAWQNALPQTAAENPTLASLDLASLPTSSIEAYVAENVDEFWEEDLLLVAEEGDTPIEMQVLPGTGVSAEALEEYLEDFPEDGWEEELFDN